MRNTISTSDVSFHRILQVRSSYDRDQIDIGHSLFSVSVFILLWAPGMGFGEPLTIIRSLQYDLSAFVTACTSILALKDIRTRVF